MRVPRAPLPKVGGRDVRCAPRVGDVLDADPLPLPSATHAHPHRTADPTGAAVHAPGGKKLLPIPMPDVIVDDGSPSAANGFPKLNLRSLYRKKLARVAAVFGRSPPAARGGAARQWKQQQGGGGGPVPLPPPPLAPAGGDGASAVVARRPLPPLARGGGSNAMTATTSTAATAPPGGTTALPSQPFGAGILDGFYGGSGGTGAGTLVTTAPARPNAGGSGSSSTPACAVGVCTELCGCDWGLLSGAPTTKVAIRPGGGCSLDIMIVRQGERERERERDKDHPHHHHPRGGGGGEMDGGGGGRDRDGAPLPYDIAPSYAWDIAKFTVQLPALAQKKGLLPSPPRKGAAGRRASGALGLPRPAVGGPSGLSTLDATPLAPLAASRPDAPLRPCPEVRLAHVARHYMTTVVAQCKREHTALGPHDWVRIARQMRTLLHTQGSTSAALPLTIRFSIPVRPCPYGGRMKPLLLAQLQLQAQLQAQAQAAAAATAHPPPGSPTRASPRRRRCGGPPQQGGSAHGTPRQPQGHEGMYLCSTTPRGAASGGGEHDGEADDDSTSESSLHDTLARGVVGAGVDIADAHASTSPLHPVIIKHSELKGWGAGGGRGGAGGNCHPRPARRKRSKAGSRRRSRAQPSGGDEQGAEGDGSSGTSSATSSTQSSPRQRKAGGVGGAVATREGCDSNSDARNSSTEAVVLDTDPAEARFPSLMQAIRDAEAVPSVPVADFTIPPARR